MEKRKKKTGRIIALIVLFIVIVAIAAAGWYFFLRQEDISENTASILSTHVKTGSIQKTLSGTGTLAEQEAQNIAVQTGVKVTEYLVKNGQIVKAGDPVAAVNRASVMEAISSLREVMTEVSADIDEIQSTSLTTTLTAAATGRVKAIYASEGEQVQDVLLRDGALAVLSLDGLMAAGIPMEASVGIGETVAVTLSDGTELPGRVETTQEGIATITIDDEYGKIGEIVQVKTADGRFVGSGLLYVHSAWKAFASEGLVYGVYAYDGQIAEAGVILFRIDLPPVNGGYEALAAEHREYEEVLAELFRMYDSGVVTAPCDGCVSGVDESILKLLSTNGYGYQLELLSYEDGEGEYRNRVGMVTGVNSDGSITAMMQGWDTEIVDYIQTGYVETSADTMTQSYSASYPYAFTWDGSQWQRKNIEVGDVYLFAYDSTDLAMMVYVGHNDYDPSSSQGSSGKDDNSKSDSSKDENGKTKDGSENGEKKEGEESQDGKKDSGSGGNKGGMASGGGGISGNGNTTEAQAAKRYDTTGTTILSITPQETVSVTITVDELDILSVQEGQKASVTLDALTGRSFTGIISDVDTTAANEGGNTKYSATIQMEKEGLMLGGMNASVYITIDSRENVLLIPSEALTEKNGKSAVYTAYNERTGTLSKPVEVETGLSDGLQVEILTGLKEGDTVWYSYYDKLEIAGLTT
ncbi:MAG: HlyD family efflux transporter periplasmic adaptor subunit [Oscillospiraceae bacterium]|nr:HlyD family efflux transporter periplasmic adaptor subunit [Oscillospiraceae bacterium]